MLPLEAMNRYGGLIKSNYGKIVTNLDDLTDADLGNAEKVEEKKIENLK